MARITVFRSRKQIETSARLERIKQEADALAVEGETPRMRSLARELAREAARMNRCSDESLWKGGYFMLSRKQTEYVLGKFRELKRNDRPIQVRDAFLTMMINIRPDTGELLMSRVEFAKLLGIAPSSVSSIMGTLERIGVVLREPTPGSPRTVTYRINANVGWQGSLDARKVESIKVPMPSETKPPLKVLKGGRSKEAR